MIRIMWIVVLFLLSFSVSAEEYRSVDDYITYKTGGKLNDFKYDYSSESIYKDINETYSKKIKNYNKYILGYLKSTINEQAFIFILNKNNKDMYREVFNSKPFFMSNMMWVEKISANSKYKFQILIQSGSPSSPESSVFTVKLIKDKWRVIALSSDSLGECGEEIIPVSSYLVNFITGKVEIDKYIKCSPKGSRKYNKKFPKLYLFDFNPMDDIYNIYDIEISN